MPLKERDALGKSDWRRWLEGGNGGPWGQGPRNTGGGGSTPPDLEELLRRGQDRLRRVLPGGGGGGGGGRMNPLTLIAILVVALALAELLFLHVPRAAGRRGRGAALRRVQPHGPARPEFPPALPDRGRLHAQGHAREPGHDRAGVGRPQSERQRPRHSRREPDADRRREYRRHRLLGLLGDQQRRRLPVQHGRSRTAP